MPHILIYSALTTYHAVCSDPILRLTSGHAVRLANIQFSDHGEVFMFLIYSGLIRGHALCSHLIWRLSSGCAIHLQSGLTSGCVVCSQPTTC